MMTEASLDDYETESKSSAVEEVSSELSCQSGESMAEWRSSEQVENRTPSTSPGYSDSDDDGGLLLKDLYNKFTWKIENFSDISKKELRSNIFNVGGHKWYILIYPQGCDVCNHLSLFLCVANYDKLLPGWSHFAQFTIAVINKDPKKSKYSDTLHRFWKKEHDWGWKKFMELSKLKDGFVVDNVLVIKAQVQVVREKADRPFRCLYVPYRRELLRVYMSNVEQICRRFIDEKRGKLRKLIDDKLKWSSFRNFWLMLEPSVRWRMSRENTTTILKTVVKHFFIEKEVISTLVMESLYCGLKSLESQNKSTRTMAKVVEGDVSFPLLIHVDQDLFVLSSDVLDLIERAVAEALPHHPVPAKDDRCTQNRLKDGGPGEEFNKDLFERDDMRLTDLGRRTIEIFILVHIFSRIEVAYQEAISLKIQEELIREEEAAELAEIERKRSIADKRRSKKKQAKIKRSTRKDKGKEKAENFVDIIKEVKNEMNLPNEGMSNEAEEILADREDMSCVSGNGSNISQLLQPNMGVTLPTTGCDINALDSYSSSVVGDDAELQNGKKGRIPIVDDNLSTCSSESVLSDSLNGYHLGSRWTNNRVHSSKRRISSKRSKGWNMVMPRNEGAVAICDAQKTLQTLEEKTNANSGSIAGSSKDEHPLPSLGPKKLTDGSQQCVSITDNSSRIDCGSAATEISSLAESNSADCSDDAFRTKSAGSGDETALLTGSMTVPSSEPCSSTAAQTDVLARPESEATPSSSNGTARESSLGENTTTCHATALLRPLTAPQVPLTRPTEVDVPAQPVTSHIMSISAAERVANEPSPSTPSYMLQYQNATGVRNSSTGLQTNSINQPSCAESSHVPPLSSARKDLSSLRSEFTFGTFRPELLDKSKLSGECMQEANSICGSSSNAQFASIRGNTEMSSLSKQLSSIATSFRPYHPQGQVADEFPHIDIINDLLDDEQTYNPEATDSGIFTCQFSFQGTFGASDSNSVVGSLFDQSKQLYRNTLQNAFDAAPKLRTRSHSFSGPSLYYDRHDDSVNGPGPYRAVEDAIDTSWYSYQPRGYSGFSNGVSRYPGYHPAAGH